MTSTTAPAAFNLRVTRGSTGTVHAAREEQREILNYAAPYAERRTGKFETIIVKACGHDSNTFRAYRPTGLDSAAAAVTCKKCLKATA